MFTVLRVTIVIGVIFYLSPVRHGGSGDMRLGGGVKWSRDAASPGLSESIEQASRLHSLWQSLPESAKDAVMGPVAGSPAPDRMRIPLATDTLMPEDLQPHWRGDGRKRP